LLKSVNSLKTWPYIFLIPFFSTFIIFQIYPIFHSFYISLHSWNGIPAVPMKFVGLDNYVRVFTEDPFFLKAVWNTILIMFFTIPSCILLGLILANMLTSITRGRQFFQLINFLPYIVTPVAIGLLFALMFDWTTGAVNTTLIRLGLAEQGINWLGEAGYARLVVILIIIWKYTGYHMVIYLAGISAISSEIFEAAKVDGASAMRTFWQITVPLLTPITIFLVITDMIGSLQLFDEAALLFSTVQATPLIGGPDKSVLTGIWYFYFTTFTNSRFGFGAAVSFSLFLIIMVISLLSYKFLNRERLE
jgi:cellobiose transport system permease protein